MKIQSTKIVYFSPTGTTKTIIQSFVQGLNLSSVELIDITKPVNRQKTLQTSENDLLVIAAPVYMGRIPAVLSEYLNAIIALNTPTVCVVVYGNRAYDNALLELNDMLISRGCKVIAGAAFIGEHSFSSPDLPSSEGRPDLNDLKQAELFGQIIYKKLGGLLSVYQIPEINVSGTYPYGGVTELWKIDFIAVSDECSQCNICADGCPVGAIDSEKSFLINIEKCTLCCACIKLCPNKAKSMKAGLMKDAAIRSHNNFKERKEPELFY